MAFVGISLDLKNDIRSTIRKMREAEQNALGPNPEGKVNFTGSEQWFEDRVWGENKHLRSIVPESWLCKAESIDFYVLFDYTGEGKPTTSAYTYIKRVKAQQGEKFVLPPNYKDSYGTPDVRVSFNADEVLPEQLQDIKTYTLKNNDIKFRWDKVERQVLDFIENCKSLNEALKLWPDLKVYIPKDYIERVERKPARSEASASRAAEILSEINTDEVQAAAVIARLSGAQI